MNESTSGWDWIPNWHDGDQDSEDPKNCEPLLLSADGQLVEAEVYSGPPAQVAPNEIIPYAAVIRVHPKPDRYVFVDPRAQLVVNEGLDFGVSGAYDPSIQPTTESTNANADGNGLTIIGGFSIDEDPDALYFVFDKLSFPKAGKFQLTFDISAWDRDVEVIGDPEEVLPEADFGGPYLAGTLVPVEGVVVEVREGAQMQNNITLDQRRFIDKLFASGRNMPDDKGT